MEVRLGVFGKNIMRNANHGFWKPEELNKFGMSLPKNRQHLLCDDMTLKWCGSSSSITQHYCYSSISCI